MLCTSRFIGSYSSLRNDEKSVFKEVGGLDEEHFKVAFNDIDLCMKIRKAGYLVVWTPYAEAYHYESISRGAEDTSEKQERFRGEVAAFMSKWKKNWIWEIHIIIRI